MAYPKIFLHTFQSASITQLIFLWNNLISPGPHDVSHEALTEMFLYLDHSQSHLLGLIALIHPPSHPSHSP